MTAPIDSITSDDWLRFLERQRWFAAKGVRATGVRVASMALVPWGTGAFSIVRLVVTFDGDGPRERTYQLPVAVRDTLPSGVPKRAVIAMSARGSGDHAAYDAVYDAHFRDGLAVALSAGAIAHGEAADWIVEPIADHRMSLPSSIATVIGSAEQSNTSFVVNDAVIVKLFRMLQPGVHPDVELTELLTTRTSFRGTPPLIATLRFEDRAAAQNRGVTTAGMAQVYLPGSTDAWRYTLDAAAPYFSAPPERDIHNAYLADAARLGAATRAMHEALASVDDVEDVAPADATVNDLEQWGAQTKQRVDDALSLLDRQIESPEFPAVHAAEARALAGRRVHYLGWIDEIVDSLGDDLGELTRVHGDYHLGQVLRTTHGPCEFMIIDFEGEPSRPLSDRRAKTSPLRDVAGMLRSFSYAAATLTTGAGAKLDLQTRELRAARWERDVRAAYLAAYLAEGRDEAGVPRIIPEDDEHVRQLIALFETEKAFYELAYELNNRPAWAWIPMRGVAKLFTRR